jgi:hypothetical protein
VSAVVESLIEAQLIRPLDVWELDFICGWMYQLFARRSCRANFLEEFEDVADVLDQFFLYWPDHFEDIWVDRANCKEIWVDRVDRVHGFWRVLDVFVYSKDND